MLARIDVQQFARDVIFAAEEGHGAGDIFGLARAVEGAASAFPGPVFVGCLAPGGLHDGARHNGVDAYSRPQRQGADLRQRP